MKTLIVYATHHGCTEQCAELLKQRLGGEAERVLVGGSIHVGKVQRAVKRFCREHLEALLTKQLGLLLSCMAEGADAPKQFDEAFPEVLRRHARATGIFGGAFRFEKMNVIERAVILAVSGMRESVKRVRQQAIDDFLARL